MTVDSDKRKTFDISTLNTKRKLKNEKHREENVFYKNLHVKQTREQLNNMIIPRGFTMKTHPYDINERMQSEGTLITVYCSNRYSNILCAREQEELDAFINTKLDVIRDNPYELKGHTEKLKIDAKIFTEKQASKAVKVRE
jgi:hypothetical protein